MGQLVNAATSVPQSPVRDAAERANLPLLLDALFIGEWIPRRRLEPRLLRRFLERAEVYAARSRALARDGTEDALAALERFMSELCGGGSFRRAA
jgi:hypothetical protein